jgi:uncharacterized protein YciI
MSARPARPQDVPRNLKSYFLCLLRKGPRWNETGDSPELMLEHLAFLRAQFEARKFLVAGPVVDNADDLVGISIIAAASAEEAQELANLDPGAVAGRLKMEIRPVFLPSLDGVRAEY